MSEYYIYSTLSCDTKYTLWKKSGGGDLNIVDRAVLVKGGANVANKHFLTPKGAVTKVTEQQIEILKNNEVFQRHLERGYISIEKVEADIEKVVSNMTGRAPDAPLVPEDFEAEGVKAPKNNNKSKSKKDE